MEELVGKVDKYLVDWRNERESEHKTSIAFSGYQRDSTSSGQTHRDLVPAGGSGEIKASVRGDDLYLIVDVCNYSQTYSLCGMVNHMSPDDRLSGSERVIAAAGGKARRINVIMPFCMRAAVTMPARESFRLRAGRELVDMGVENIITFDAHDPRVQNAIPLKGFETVQPIYQFIKYLLKNEKELRSIAIT